MPKTPSKPDRSKNNELPSDPDAQMSRELPEKPRAQARRASPLQPKAIVPGRLQWTPECRRAPAPWVSETPSWTVPVETAAAAKFTAAEHAAWEAEFEAALREDEAERARAREQAAAAGPPDPEEVRRAAPRAIRSSTAAQWTWSAAARLPSAALASKTAGTSTSAAGACWNSASRSWTSPCACSPGKSLPSPFGRGAGGEGSSCRMRQKNHRDDRHATLLNT